MSKIGGKKLEKQVQISTKFTPRFLENLDGRRAAVRELERRFNKLVSDLGGNTYLSYQQTALARRAIHLEARPDLELDRQTKLLADGWVTQARVDTVQATESAARASVIAAQAALELSKLDLSYTTLTHSGL